MTRRKITVTLQETDAWEIEQVKNGNKREKKIIIKIEEGIQPYAIESRLVRNTNCFYETPTLICKISNKECYERNLKFKFTK